MLKFIVKIETMDCQKNLFSLDGNSTYLNAAYMSPIPDRVASVGSAAILGKQNPARITPDDFFTDTNLLRKEFAKLINAGDPNRVVVIPSVSYGMANVARNVSLNGHRTIVLAGEQFPSNVYPWHGLSRDTGAKLKTIAPPIEPEHRGKRWNEHILNAIDKDTAVVAISNVHWADGTKFDLVAIGERAREVGALLIIDGTQSVGALPFDVEEVKPDALICAGYKWLFGPYGIGVAYYGPVFDNGTPVEENWINRKNSEDFAGLVSYENEYQPGALRYEVGEHSNFILVPMMLEALRMVNEWGPDNIQQYCKSLVSTGLEELVAKGFSIEDVAYRASHLFGIRLPDTVSLEKVKSTIAEANISVSVRGNAVRVAPHVYNDAADFSKLVSCLKSTL